MTNLNPPQLFLRFFRWFCHPKLRDSIEGDLMELYGERKVKSTKWKADIKFSIDVLLLFRPGIIKPVEGYKNVNTYGMYKSYFKIGWRNLVKNKGYSFINIFGLAMGMMVAIIIGLWVEDELSFNSYFKKHTRLAEVMLNQTNEGITYTGETIAPPIENPIRVKYANDFKATSLVSWENYHVIALENKNLSASGIWVESDFPKMFTLSMISGSNLGLQDPSTVLISKSLAKALFGSGESLNKSIRFDSRFDMIVGGVFEDFPRNTLFSGIKVLMPWSNKDNWLRTVTDWDNHSCRMFVELADNADASLVTEKIKNIPTPYIKEWKEEIMLHPMDQLHLYNRFVNGEATGGHIQFVWLVGTIGAFVLLLACINFMNLSTARSEKRAKEVGIRKSIGSLRGQLVSQFLSESILVALIALVFSLMLVQLSLPFFNALADKVMVVNWASSTFWLLVIGFALFCGIISGSYPAFYLSSFLPVKVLKGRISTGRLAGLSRKVLVVIQFTVSVTLIIGTVIIFKQIQFAKDRPAGFLRAGLITLPINTPELEKHKAVIQSELLQTGVIQNTSLSSQSPASFNNNNSLDWQGKDHSSEIFFSNVTITPEFGKTIGWSIVQGRDFSSEIVSDSSAVIINEAGARLMGFKNPIGEIVKYEGDKKSYAIIGIVKDMTSRSPYERVEPAVFFMRGWLGLFVVRLKPQVSLQNALAKIETVFRKNNPNAPFEFQFVDEEYGRMFSDEERMGKLASLFAVLAIVISCLGLLGLASFVAEQRTKEIGVRKILGASVGNLWKMLSGDFVMLVLISCAISIPVASYYFHNWLQQYDYRTDISWWIFAASCLGALAITLLTVSYQAIKAATANPVNSLRSE
jgi:ABC-type antimicrobial peptide transport system permease subunit